MPTAARARLAPILLLALVLPPAAAGPLRERAAAARAEAAATVEDDDDRPAGPVPHGVAVLRDLAYADHPLTRLDVYRPAQTQGAPLVVMVHGGGWRRGDKAARSVVQNKVARWVPRGVLVVSVNYPLLPEAAPARQADHLANALAFVQKRAAAWGGDPERIVLMGHSAGAHLAALLAGAPEETLARRGARAPVGVVLLDSAALDVPALMRGRHLSLFDRAFGGDPAHWPAVSPLHRLTASAPPMLAVCSSRRAEACPQAEAFARHGAGLGVRIEVLPLDLSHREINLRLGEDAAYTRDVERFLRGLDEAFARRL